MTQILTDSPNSCTEECIHKSQAISLELRREKLGFDSGPCGICGELTSNGTGLYQSTSGLYCRLSYHFFPAGTWTQIYLQPPTNRRL
jgi:hypothetical protein